MPKTTGYMKLNLPSHVDLFEVGKTYQAGIGADGEMYGFIVETDVAKFLTECPFGKTDGMFLAALVEADNPHPDTRGMPDPDRFRTVTVITLLTFEQLFQKSIMSASVPQGDEDGCLYQVRGDETILMSLQDCQVLSGVGKRNTLVSSGSEGILLSDCDDDVVAVVGEDTDIFSAGNNSVLIAAGSMSGIQSMGAGSSLASAGHSSHLTSIKDECELAASGYLSSLRAFGDRCRLASSGAYSDLIASGQNCVISACGAESTATGSEGTWIALAEFDEDLNCIGFVTGCVGQGDLKPGVKYRAVGGRFVEVPDFDDVKPDQNADR